MAEIPDARGARKAPLVTGHLRPAIATLEGIGLDTVLNLLAERLAERLEARAAGPAVRWASAKDNPLGSSRAFLDAARRGDFETFKRGREVVARWADVEAHIERRRVTRKRGAARPASSPATSGPAVADLTARRLEKLRAEGILPRKGAA